VDRLPDRHMDGRKLHSYINTHTISTKSKPSVVCSLCKNCLESIKFAMHAVQYVIKLSTSLDVSIYYFVMLSQTKL